MVTIVPVVLGMPAMSVFIPPAVNPSPTKLARFVKLMAGPVGLGAVPSVVFGGFVETMVGPGNAAPAIMFLSQGGRGSS